MVSAAVIVLALIRVPTTPLTGTVEADDGTPVVGADLILTDPKPGDAPVVARGKSGEGGAFRLERPAGLAPEDRYLAPTLWVVAPGRAVGVVKFTGTVPGADEPVKVVLRPEARTEVRVEAPDGAPVAGARVLVQRVKSEPLMVPEVVQELTERTTGPDGLAVVTAFGPDELTCVDVKAKGHGIQPRWFDPETPGRKTVKLRAVETLKGRVTPEVGGAKAAQGWRVRAWSHDRTTDPRKPELVGYGSATTDDEGRFTITEIVPGSLQLAVFRPDGSDDLLPELPQAPAVRQGRENVLEIPLRRPATVAGRVVEHGTGKPVVGMRVHLFQGAGVDRQTDEDGRYTFRCLPGKVSVWAPKAPPGYVSLPGLNKHDVEVPAAPGRVDLGATELIRTAPPLRGVVRDEAGKPVAGAVVGVQWSATSPVGSASGTNSATSDGEGRFALADLAPGAKVTLTARGGDLATAAPVTATTGSDELVVLTAVTRPAVAVSVRVTGPGGEPVPGARVDLRVRETAANAPNPFGTPVALQVRRPTRTGPDGVFRTPRELEREGREYQAEITADGFHPAKTSWVATAGGDLLDLPGVALRRVYTVRVVAGRVSDRAGGPVAGARVFQAGDGPTWSEATTDDAGRFRLAGVYSGAALVFAEKDGFRFGGVVVGPGNDPVAVTLTRDGEAPAAVLKTLPSPMGRDRERALARELLAPVLPQARAGAISHYGPKAIPALARVDPGRVLEMIEARVVPPASALVQVALGRFEDDPREAVALIEDDLEPATRGSGFLALADATPRDDRDRRNGSLDRALAEARRVAAPEAKLSLLIAIAGRWLDLGDLDRARPVLREGQALVEAWPGNSYSYQVEEFGELLAVTDLPAARALIGGKGARQSRPAGDPSTLRHLGEAAIRVAAFDPVGAEKLLPVGAVGTNLGDRENLAFRVAREMARADLPRARKLLQTLADAPEDQRFARPALVPFGLGLMAADRAATDPETARGLLDEAFAGLAKLARDADGRTNPEVSNVMAALLPAVERVAPDRVAERLWLAASCRPPRAQEPDAGAVVQAATLALLVSRYDRAAARTIAAPALERLAELLGGMDQPGYFDERMYGILTAYDPDAIAALIRDLPASARKTEQARNGSLAVAADVVARLAAAEMLGYPIAERRRAAIVRSNEFFRMPPERP